jgi:methylaspartate ammonia-lyase
MMSRYTRNECVVKDQGRNMMMKMDVYGVVEEVFCCSGRRQVDFSQKLARSSAPLHLPLEPHEM